MKKIIGYIRVSTDEQARSGFSLDVQREAIQAQCKAKGWEPPEIYADEGQSGAGLSRPSLQAVISRIAFVGDVDMVIVHKLDRLSRSQKDTLYLIEDVFTKNNVGFMSVTESIDTQSAMGKAMIGVMAVFAQLERGLITERTSSGRMKKAAEGKYSGGKPPYGYYRDIDGKLKVNDEQAKAIQRIFKLRKNGYSMAGMLKTLKTAGYKTAEGKDFHETTIARVLSREDFYKGAYRYNGVMAQGEHEPILRG